MFGQWEKQHPDQILLIPLARHPSMEKHAVMKSFQSQLHTVAILVPLCDYLLTDHLHGYQHFLQPYCWGMNVFFSCSEHTAWAVEISYFLLSQIIGRHGDTSAFSFICISTPPTQIIYWNLDRFVRHPVQSLFTLSWNQLPVDVCRETLRRERQSPNGVFFSGSSKTHLSWLGMFPKLYQKINNFLYLQNICKCKD